ncbi:MAG: LuxR C-terminal-related transcriptional regulator [Thermomicrobiales bacterium]
MGWPASGATDPARTPISWQFRHAGTRTIRARFLIRDGHASDARALLCEWLQLAKRSGNVAVEIRCAILLAIAERALGHPAEAATWLQRALELAAPGSFIRSFLDTGYDLLPEIRALLPSLNADAHAHALALLDTATVHVPSEGAKSDPWPTSPARARGACRAGARQGNREMAESLFISERTVKKHLANIFRKTRSAQPLFPGALGAGHLRTSGVSVHHRQDRRPRTGHGVLSYTYPRTPSGKCLQGTLTSTCPLTQK